MCLDLVLEAIEWIPLLGLRCLAFHLLMLFKVVAAVTEACHLNGIGQLRNDSALGVVGAMW